MQSGNKWNWMIGASAALLLVGCSGGETASAATGASHSTMAATTAAVAATAAPSHGSSNSAYDKPGFATHVEDGRLWVMRPGQEASEKHITMIGAGPNGMSIKALDKQTALAYVATKPGFTVNVTEDNRLWVLRDGQEESEKHITMIGAGPRKMTIKALDKQTALAYIATKPGFSVQVTEDNRLWVLRDGQEESEKHITMIGAGPMGLTIKALDKQTALAYIAAKPGFDVQVTEDNRLWVLRPGQEESEKHITMIGAGPRGMTIKAIDRPTALAYLAAE